MSTLERWWRGMWQPELRRGSRYPVDVARRRAALGLPVTPDEHLAYARWLDRTRLDRDGMRAILALYAPRLLPREPGSDDA